MADRSGAHSSKVNVSCLAMIFPSAEANADLAALDTRAATGRWQRTALDATFRRHAAEVCSSESHTVPNLTSGLAAQLP